MNDLITSNMIQLTYIIGLAMAIVNLFKKRVPANAVPLIAVAVVIALNLGNAILFGGDPLLAFKDAFIGAGILVGLFAASDTRSNRDAVTLPLSSGIVSTAVPITMDGSELIKPEVTE